MEERASLAMCSLAMEEWGTPSPAWHPRTCPVLVRPTMEERGALSPAWLSRPGWIWRVPTWKREHTFPGLSLQCLLSPGDAICGREGCSFPDLAS